MQITEVSLVAFAWAFIAGLASFLSPCVLPLLPGYLSYVSGVGIDELGARTRKVALASVAFVAGFTIFFALQGAAAGFAGSALGDFLSYFTSTTGGGKRGLEVVAGALLIAFGAYIVGEVLRHRVAGRRSTALAIFAAAVLAVLALAAVAGAGPGGFVTSVIVYFLVAAAAVAAFATGLYPVSALEKERRFRLLKKPAGLLGVVLAGMVFSIGIGPCTGPLLGSVIMLALGTQDPVAGASLMFVYGLGMGVPFVVSGFLFTRLISTFDVVKRHFDAIKTVSGLLLIVFGMMMATGQMEVMTAWLQRWLPSVNI